jgi:hypothetical protein
LSSNTSEYDTTTIIEKTRTFGTVLSPTSEDDINKTPKPKIIRLISKTGISTKTVTKVPAMLPIVATEYRLPDMLPSLSRVFVASFIA